MVQSHVAILPTFSDFIIKIIVYREKHGKLITENLLRTKFLLFNCFELN